MTPPFYDAATVEHLLDLPGCIDAMERAMTALSLSGREQPLRQIVRLPKDLLFGVMPGDLAAIDAFGAKLVSVAPDPARPGRSRHQGVVVLFEAPGGAVACLADAEAITAIRTACATAAATRALARPEARTLTLFGTGLQAQAHAHALHAAHRFERTVIWGRDPASAAALAKALSASLPGEVIAMADPRAAATEGDVICTVTGSPTPVLLGEWVRPGTHVNMVGSSLLGPVEVDGALVAAGRYIADYRPGALAQGSELALAREAGLVSDDHVVGEIGEVFAGRLPGRQTAEQITLYKSLGHVVQDLAATAYVHERARELAR